jgi:hypothetical protein
MHAMHAGGWLNMLKEIGWLALMVDCFGLG